MVLPTEQDLQTYSRFMYRVIIQARVLAWQKGSHEQIAALLDVIHNIPLHIERWEAWDEGFFLKSFVRAYDRRWKTDRALEKAFEDSRRGSTSGSS